MKSSFYIVKIMKWGKSNFHDNTILVTALKKGDESAYMYLLDHYHKRVHAYAHSLINDNAIAQDIVQNVFLKTWQSRKKLDSKFPIQNFLYKLIYNEFINAYQKNQATMTLQKKYIESLNEIVEQSESADFSKKIEILMAEVPNLPAKCRKVFLLSKKEGLTNIEIADYLNISIKSVESHITKAFSTLKKKVRKQA